MVKGGQSTNLTKYEFLSRCSMPRAPRIEFEDAVYHVMARGNRREPIVFHEGDRKLFVETFAEARRMTGW